MRIEYMVNSEDPESFDRAIIELEHSDRSGVTISYEGQVVHLSTADMIAALKRIKRSLDEEADGR